MTWTLESAWSELQERVAHDEYFHQVRQYFELRWGVNDFVDRAVPALVREGLIGWAGDLPKPRKDQGPKSWPFFDSHPLFVPLYDVRGKVRSGMRRTVTKVRPLSRDGREMPKSMQLASKVTKLPTGTPLYLGQPSKSFTRLCQGGPTLIIVEGEINYLAYEACRLVGQLDAVVVGFTGALGRSAAWWSELKGMLLERTGGFIPKVVVACDNDKAGRAYRQMAASTFEGAEFVAYPLGWDACDVLAKDGPEMLRVMSRYPQPTDKRFWCLDDGGYAYLAGDRWVEVKSKEALIAHIEQALTVDRKVAREHGKMLPAAAGMRFEPTSTDRVIQEGPRYWLNAFYGLPLSPSDDGSASIYERLLLHLVGYDAEAAHYVLRWLAMPLQALHAGRGAWKTGQTLVFMGVPGSGKGRFIKALRAIYRDYWFVLLQDQLQDKFAPEDLDRQLLVAFEEVGAAIAGARDGVAMMQRVKLWTSEDIVPVRYHFKGARNTRVYFNSVATSNFTRPLPYLDDDDRRYSFFEQWTPLPEDLAAELALEEELGWPNMGAWLLDLLTMEVRRTKMKPFDNVTRQRQLRVAGNPMSQFANEVNEFGMQAVAVPYVMQEMRAFKDGFSSEDWAKVDADRRTCTVHHQKMHEIFRAWVTVNYSERVRSSTEELADVLGRRLPGLERKRFSIKGRQLWGFSGLRWQSDEQQAKDKKAAEF